MIGLKVYEQIDYIASEDTALDRDAPGFDWDKYWETTDPKFAPLKPGCSPTAWRLKRLSRRAYVHILGLPQSERTTEALAYGLVDVQNLTRNGQPVVVRKERKDYGERLTEDSLDAVFVPSVVAELGLRILTLSGLDPTIGQGS